MSFKKIHTEGCDDMITDDELVRLVEDALLRRAMGMTVTESRTELTEKGEKTVTVEKELPPDLTAITFWLKNRCPELWREKPAEAATQPENNLPELLSRMREG